MTCRLGKIPNAGSPLLGLIVVHFLVPFLYSFVYCLHFPFDIFYSCPSVLVTEPPPSNRVVVVFFFFF